ncbi:hypothetical protein P4V58_11555 [Bacillus wiedmannii]|uniref:hypothetical protein n=1 Tax=Bacillus wiedmannii TaxID=1890302 RepID=UPI002E1E5E44|nr:hypothetical protein [Bacillus wiedmannii]
MTAFNTLFVPITIEAFVVNEQMRKQQQFRRFQMSYSSLDEFLSPEALPFSGGQDDFNQYPENEGVYLHWTLPKAMRRGKQDDMGQEEFPLVPNRWLVVRLSGSFAERRADAWVVESDYIDPEKGSSPFINPRTQTKTMIGRKLPLSGHNQWTETDDEESSLFLTAIGTGDLTFSLYQPNVENVFSIHDPLSIEGIDIDTLSYFVVGWYSRQEEDIINDWETAEEYIELLNDLNWKIANDDVGLSKKTLYHGMVYGVEWDRKHMNVQTARDTANPMVAVGNTSTEALLALLFKISEYKKDDRQLVQFLQAIRYQMLMKVDQSDADHINEQNALESKFGSSSGGLVWSVVDRDDLSDLSGNTELQEDEEKLLATLNTDQNLLDEARRQLKTSQRQLYELWWKDGRATALENTTGQMPDGTDKFNFYQELEKLRRKVDSQIQTVQDLEGKVPIETATQTLEKSAEIYARQKGFPSHRRLVPAEMPRFWFMQDPVVLFAGLPYQKEVKDSLYCRYPWQVVKSFTFSNQGINTRISIEQLRDVIPPVNLESLPLEVQNLYEEFFLLDPYHATIIAKKCFPDADEELIRHLFETMEVRQTYEGILPAIGVQRWEQPWQPLFLEWEVNWRPLPFMSGDHLNWRFDGNKYVCESREDEQSEKIQVINGRTFLTPQATSTLRARLKQLLDEHVLEEELRELIEGFLEGMQDWNVLSQMMSGFQNQLAMRNIGANVDPKDDLLMEELLEGSSHLAPIPGPAYGSSFLEEKSSGFQPTGNGQFCFQRLLIVDRFGQTLEVINDQGQFCPSIDLVLSDELSPDSACMIDDTKNIMHQYVQLRPRILQGSRLHFQWVSAKKDEVHPVCGWILPNHIDRALSVYDRNGLCLGMLAIAKQEIGLCIVQWRPAPDSPYPDLENIEIYECHLYKFLKGLVEAGEQEFVNFIQTIDSTLWTCDPLGEREDKNLSVLIGRPIPIVRVRLELELDGEPLEDPSWNQTFEEQKFDLLNYPFSIRLGDLDMRSDGLLGYYVEKDYTRFNAVFNFLDSNYIQGIGEKDNNGNANFINLKVATPIDITLLMLPHAKVHAFTGILPYKTLELPKEFIEPVLMNMKVHFHTGPFLTNFAAISEDAKAILVSTPNVQSGRWSWVERTPAQSWAKYAVLNPGEKDAPTTTPPLLREGLLRLEAFTTDSIPPSL